MQKSHSATKSITYSDHTLHCAGFVHKVRHRDKIKTVRIKSMEQQKKAVRAYRNVAISHIKNLRQQFDVEDPTHLHSNLPFSKLSFFHDATLSHSLDPTRPLTNSDKNFAGLFSPPDAKAPTTPAVTRQNAIKSVMASGSTAGYKQQELLDLQNSLPPTLKNQFSLAKIKNSSLTLQKFLLDQPKNKLPPEVNEALQASLIAEAKAKPNNNHLTQQQQQLTNATHSLPPFTFSHLNFKPPRVMALDIGTQYIGVALSDEHMEKALPMGVINLFSSTPTNAEQQSFIQTINPTYRIDPYLIAEHLNEIRTRYNVICTCIGLPQSEYNQHMIEKIKRFTSNMINMNGLGDGRFEVCYVDEHSSTQQARQRLLNEDNRDAKEAAEMAGYSHTGQGGERVKRLRAKSKYYDDDYQKKKGLDAEAAAIILERFIDVHETFGEKYSPKAHKQLEDIFGPSSLHCM